MDIYPQWFETITKVKLETRISKTFNKLGHAQLSRKAG